MARIDILPEQSIIDGYKGKLDFYVHKGQPCVRSWPRYTPRQPYPLEKANQQAFAYINKLWTTIPPFIRQQYQRMAIGTDFRAQDIFVRGYMHGLNY